MRPYFALFVSLSLFAVSMLGLVRFELETDLAKTWNHEDSPLFVLEKQYTKLYGQTQLFSHSGVLSLPLLV